MEIIRLRGGNGKERPENEPYAARFRRMTGIFRVVFLR